MRSLKLVNLFVVVLLLAVGCNKEDMGKKSTGEENAQQVVVPAPCKAGEEIPMTPAPMLPEELAAALATKADQIYTIPVVFHVFGTSHTDGWAKSGTMNGARFEKILTWINNDYNGVKNVGDIEYFGNIHESRKEFVDYLPVQFVLAKYTKDGVALADGQKVYGGKVLESSVTNCGTISGNGSVIIYSASHPLAKVGIGKETSVTPKLVTELKKVAWDNKMYMNVYIVNDLFVNGEKNNSGIAWLPNMSMTNANLARVVYNGTYLPGNINGEKDFTSIISHEFGHFLNLSHTFDGGCVVGKKDSSSEGDYCADTPAMLQSANNPAYTGHGKKNCNGTVIDYGNFMNYGVYSNFTKDQVTRMKAALQNPARKPLWQQSNLDKVLGDGFRDPATFGEKLQDINNKLGK